ncbi:hypothetical protein E2C01_082460 [Portunus trituberculatus]|uniref:Uncharacterized protein n=1 Tax=Portunus trituberculatus TaxID=210409 RepID=A0A5B7J505_PORTR|nr:hypothetical protein [Portunus trituberculatus]
MTKNSSQQMSFPLTFIFVSIPPSVGIPTTLFSRRQVSGRSDVGSPGAGVFLHGLLPYFCGKWDGGGGGIGLRGHAVPLSASLGSAVTTQHQPRGHQSHVPTFFEGVNSSIARNKSNRNKTDTDADGAKRMQQDRGGERRRRPREEPSEGNQWREEWEGERRERRKYIQVR